MKTRPKRLYSNSDSAVETYIGGYGGCNATSLPLLSVEVQGLAAGLSLVCTGAGMHSA